MRFILFVLLFFILFRVVAMVLRMLVGTPRQQNFTEKKPPNSNLNVDKGGKDSKGYKGGEYVDYEEVD